MHHQSTFARRVCHQNNYSQKSSNNAPVFPVCNVEVPPTISYSAHWVVVDRRCAVGCANSKGRTSMLAAEANNFFFQRPKRPVAIRRDGDDFVVSLMPNDLVIFRNESADALRKLCKGLRWAVVSDTAIASI
jgi:hypothetical protein